MRFQGFLSLSLFSFLSFFFLLPSFSLCLSLSGVLSDYTIVLLGHVGLYEFGWRIGSSSDSRGWNWLLCASGTCYPGTSHKGKCKGKEQGQTSCTMLCNVRWVQFLESKLKIPPGSQFCTILNTVHFFLAITDQCSGWQECRLCISTGGVCKPTACMNTLSLYWQTGLSLVLLLFKETCLTQYRTCFSSPRHAQKVYSLLCTLDNPLSCFSAKRNKKRMNLSTVSGPPWPGVRVTTGTCGLYLQSSWLCH